MQLASETKATRREWIGLIVLMLPTILIAMDLTVLHLAVPHLSAALQPSGAQLLWITDIYGFMIAGSLITMGTLGDRIGRRKLLMIGAAAFGAASIVAAFSTSASMLIAARALLGIAGATLMPSTMSLIRNMFHDPRQRTVAIGIWVSGFSVGSSVGPLIGGLLLERFWWGSVFLLGVPVMGLLLTAGPLLLPEYKDPNPGRFDLPSAGLSLAAVLSIIYGLKQIAESGFTAVAVIAVVAGIVIGIIFVRRQQTLADPLIDLRLFQVRAFSVALATYTFGIFVAFGSFLFIAQYLQLVLGLSPLEAGMWALPGAVTSIFGSNIAPILVRRIRPAYVVSAGLALAGVGTALLTQTGTDSLALAVIGNALMSLGFGFTFTLTADMVVTAAPPERAGAASAISETGAEFGGALGIAVLGSIGMAVYRNHIASGMPPGLPTETIELAKETLGGAVKSAAELGNAAGAALATAAHEAFVDGLHIVAAIGAAGFFALALLTVIALRRIVIHGSEEAAVELSSRLAEAEG
jgi:DHA2 family multidrug resistance protein-like MFS transporter